MLPEDKHRFPPVSVRLKDGRAATIRLLDEADANALAEFYEAVPDADYRFYCAHRLDREHARKKAARADTPNFVCLVLQAPEGALGGYAWYDWPQDKPQRSTFGICVRPNYKGVGAGKALMERLLAVAAKYGPPVMGLTVQLANPVAVALYQKMGFRIVKQQMRGPVDGGKFPPEPEYAMERKVRDESPAGRAQP